MSQRRGQPRQAVDIVSRQEVIDVLQHDAHAGSERLESVKPQQWIEPDQPAAGFAKPFHGRLQSGAAIAIQSVVPEKAASLLDQLGIPAGERSFAALDDREWFNRLVASGYTVAPPTPLFPRLELPAEEG